MMDTSEQRLRATRGADIPVRSAQPIEEMGSDVHGHTRDFGRVLMVCVGNICRSPMAEVVLRARLADAAVIVESAGLAALSGSAIDPLAQAVLEAHGLSGRSHVARQVKRSLIEAADLVLVMEKKHLDIIQGISFSAVGKTFLLGKWDGDIDIPDPYRQGRDAFLRSYQQIDRALGSWQELLRRAVH
jgi:protein-tyrosine phosphatase